ncbi:MAG: rod shape-determining protein MreD [Methylococcales bacterium]
MNSSDGYGRILFTLAIAMSLRIAPWPDSISLFNPDWILLTLIYWALALPERVGVFHAWAFGILTEVLTGRLFGQYALAYSLCIYFCLKRHKRLRHMPLLQQGLFIFFCLLLSDLLTFWLKTLQHSAQMQPTFLLPIITGTLCWPVVYTTLRHIRLLKQRR